MDVGNPANPKYIQIVATWEGYYGTYFVFGRFQTSIDSPAESLKNYFLDGSIAKKDEG